MEYFKTIEREGNGRKTNKTLFEYLDRIVKAVDIPKFCEPEEGKEYGPPPLILDGASGVGKTQQAFALLKKRGRICYILPHATNFGQPIYENLDKHLEFKHFLDKLDKCMKHLKKMPSGGYPVEGDPVEDEPSTDTKEYKYKDAFSLETINTELDYDKTSINELVNELVKALLFWRSEGDNAKALDLDNAAEDNDGGDADNENFLQKLKNTRIFDQNGLRRLLKGTILFIDEALPNPDRDETSMDVAKTRLRFLRNVGRALGMQVIPAGTSAVAVNMIDEVAGGASATSREDLGYSFHWASCTFLKYDFKEDELKRLCEHGNLKFDAHFNKLEVTKKQLFSTLVRTHRPLFVHQFLRVKYQDSTLTERLTLIGQSLCLGKGLHKEDKGLRFTWLTGVWLKRDILSSSPYAIQAANLVRGHFFEPALMVHSKSKAPYITSGSARCSTVEAPLRIEVYNISQDSFVESDGCKRWLLKLEKKPARNSDAAMTKEFRNVKNSMSVCTQQCLFHEPLLAIALSTQHRLSVDEFQRGIYRCIQESHAERTLSSLSGEHLETVVFAALQVANGKEIRNPNTLSDFILELVKLLSPDVVREYGKEIQGPILQALELREIKILNFTHKESFHARKISMLEERDLKMVNDDIAAAAAAKEAKAEREEARKRKAEEAITPQTTKKRRTGSNSKSSIASETAPAPSTESRALRPTATATANATYIKNRLEEKVPWFVPAYMYPKDKKGYTKLFRKEELNLAALIPGGHNSRFDISAMKWPSSAVPNEPTWNFEVKARTGAYSKKEAITDLTKKCGDSEVVGKYNAMLIAVCGETETECHAWTVNEPNKKKYLRVVLRIAGERRIEEK